MSTQQIQTILQQLNADSSDLVISMVITSDGLVIAHEGAVAEPDLFGAYFVELKLTCGKIVDGLRFGDIEEIFIRSKSGCITVLPIFDKGYLACMSTPEINSSKLQLLGWRAAKAIYPLL